MYIIIDIVIIYNIAVKLDILSDNQYKIIYLYGSTKKKTYINLT